MLLLPESRFVLRRMDAFTLRRVIALMPSSDELRHLPLLKKLAVIDLMDSIVAEHVTVLRTLSTAERQRLLETYKALTQSIHTVHNVVLEESNPYRFVLNQPLLAFDPLGLNACRCQDGCDTAAARCPAIRRKQALEVCYSCCQANADNRAAWAGCFAGVTAACAAGGEHITPLIVLMLIGVYAMVVLLPCRPRIVRLEFASCVGRTSRGRTLKPMLDRSLLLVLSCLLSLSQVACSKDTDPSRRGEIARVQLEAVDYIPSENGVLLLKRTFPAQDGYMFKGQVGSCDVILATERRHDSFTLPFAGVWTAWSLNEESAVLVHAPKGLLLYNLNSQIEEWIWTRGVLKSSIAIDAERNIVAVAGQDVERNLPFLLFFSLDDRRSVTIDLKVRPSGMVNSSQGFYVSMGSELLLFDVQPWPPRRSLSRHILPGRRVIAAGKEGPILASNDGRRLFVGDQVITLEEGVEDIVERDGILWVLTESGYVSSVASEDGFKVTRVTQLSRSDILGTGGNDQVGLWVLLRDGTLRAFGSHSPRDTVHIGLPVEE